MSLDAACLSGSRNTAAIVTTPRIPAQLTTAGTCHGGAGSRSAIRRDTHRGMYVAGNTHTNRSTITATSTTAAEPAIVAADNVLSATASMMVWACRPIRKNTTCSRMN